MSKHYPLKVLFIWHHHQPYYEADGTFLMPWVRMHGIKDYWDMVRILDDYPRIRQTFNFTPVLLEQIRSYIEGTTTDAAFILSSKNPELFTDLEKVDALTTFFLANDRRMIRRYPRYGELLDKRGIVNNDLQLRSAINNFTIQDFRDLQVWWNLSWVGEYSRFDPPFKYYLDKQRNFSEEEKLGLLGAQLDILKGIIPHHVKSLKRNQIELSVSPFYHPILPLLCDSKAGVEASPEITLPDNRFKHPEDAGHQVKSALAYARQILEIRPKGMWPSEGSLSDGALRILTENRIDWTATDEMILWKTLSRLRKKPVNEFSRKYFAYNFISANKPIKIFFRDHVLSDMIGFAYSNWSPDDAAHDFVSRLLKIRDSITAEFGEGALEFAVVPIILDGENAWEFYQSDGKDFLRTLYHLLTNEGGIETVLPCEVKVKSGNTLSHIEPGSWINGNFNIWIGQQEDNRAWDLLYNARQTFDKTSKKIRPALRAEAYRELMISEGSDWCWWYGDEHKSPLAGEFDKLFRYHLKKVYVNLDLQPPAELDEPIKLKRAQLSYRQPTQMISPRLDQKKLDKEWENAGFAQRENTFGAMQKAGMLIERMNFGNDRENIFLRIITSQKISGERIVINFVGPWTVTLEIGREVSLRSGINLMNADLNEHRNEVKFGVRCSVGKDIQVALTSGTIESGEASFAVSVYEKDNLIDSWPEQGVVKFKLLQ